MSRTIAIGIPKKKYRIIVQQRTTKSNKKEASRSFMINDYTGKSNIDTIKEKLQKIK